ncbi:extracellular solute-binding protein [Paenibacillus sp. MBLB4367]|uniref:extracellular solute-binding protein n=1 Tax=Paenibacillus sp. MBLB4367 TaxID=3384767 RepID=UPI003907F3E8
MVKPNGRKYGSLFLSLVMLAGVAASALEGGSAIAVADAEVKKTAADSFASKETTEPYYYNQLLKWREQGAINGARQLTFPAKQFARKSDDAAVSAGSYGGRQDVLLWNNPKGWVEYEVEAPEAGLYEIAVDYYPFAAADGGSRQPVMLTARLNGAFPFREARSMLLEREYKDVLPIKHDTAGNEMRPLVEEIVGWKSKTLRDSGGAYAAPLQWQLQKGVNTIRIEALRQPVALGTITLKPPAALPAYSEAKAAYPPDAARKGEVIRIEAERMSAKNSTSIQNVYDRDPLTTPHTLKTISYNALGGTRWMKGGQKASWEIDVPEDGLYHIAMRVKQNARKNLAVFRSVSIDGKVPFQEMEHVKIPYGDDWQGFALADEKGERYGFYLTKGKHTLSMEAVHTPYVPIIVQIDQVSKELRAILLELRKVTGNREDKFRIWNVERDIPGMTDRLKAVRDRLSGMIGEMERINSKTDDIAHAIQNSADAIGKLLNNPDKIPQSMTELGTVQEDLESRRTMLTDAPLMLDQIYVAPADTKIPRMTAGFFQKLKSSVGTLLYSFADRDRLDEQSEEALNVWMIYGRDYVDELQQLANERFTPETGIPVKINLIQNAEMLTLANAAGMMPDVALGVPADVPFNMALRNAAVDLSKLPGADKLLGGYHPGTLLPFYYDGGYYGVPETINFKVLFYRKDILQRLGLSVPDSWDDVYRMLPTLLQNQYNFYLDPADYTPMFFQNHVELYSKDGLSTGIDTPEAFQSYKKWTEFFTKQGLERVVQSFYNRFRRGEMPIGVADFNMYMQLLVAAPELTNEWGIAPVPGTRNAGGTIERWSGGSNPQNSMLFQSSESGRQEKAWKFLQWFLSAETQTEYGLNLEQFYGETFRWNSANVEAFANMPWKPEDLNTILEQWKWTKEIQNVPGGYMTARELGFAWNRTAVNGENYRVSLEKAIKEIKRELARKQREFRLVGDDGAVLKTLDLPQVTEPWKGVESYVK